MIKEKNFRLAISANAYYHAMPQQWNKKMLQNKTDNMGNTKQLNVGLSCTFANFRLINSRES